MLEEEVFDVDDIDCRGTFHTPLETHAVIESTIVTIENDQHRHMKPRPDSLILNTTTIEDNSKSPDAKKYLYRSQSTKSFKKPKPRPSKVLSNDLDQIYVISSNNCMRSDLNDFYDSIDVIHERRSKNFSKFNEIEGDKDCETMGETSKNENVVETTVDIETYRNCEWKVQRDVQVWSGLFQMGVEPNATAIFKTLTSSGWETSCCIQNGNKFTEFYKIAKELCVQSPLSLGSLKF